ncbi:methyltransferase domain-containing protein [Thalassospira alkalitolerans]|uniref:methyltransferase domain-containing protein n=1 Tax=Thalassospira alkalitolerans TaxID=1293890 RepID=UPI003AA8B51F
MKLKFWQRNADDDGDVLDHDGDHGSEMSEFVMPDGHSLKLGTKIRAKWQGYDNPVEYYLLQKEIDDYRTWLRKMKIFLARPVEPELGELDLDHEAGRWPPERIKLYAKLFDRGIMIPGGHDYAMELAKPLALDETLSCLEIGGKLGGVARLLADKLSVWVTVYEQDDELALLGMERSVQIGVQKKVPVQTFDPSSPDLRKAYFNVVYSFGDMFRIENKDVLLVALAETLRDHGQILLTDYVLTTDASGDAVEEWAKYEDFKPCPWTADHYKSALGKLKFDIRIAKDETDIHVKQIKSAWKDMLADIQNSGLDLDMMEYLVPEMEMWMNRVKMLESGALAFYRFYATIR